MTADGWLVKPRLTKADLARLAAKWQEVKEEAATKTAPPPITVKSVRPKLRCSITAIPNGGRLVTIEESDDSDSE